MPRETLDPLPGRVSLDGSTPKTLRKRSQSTWGAEPLGGLVTTCTRSGGRPAPQRARTSGTSCRSQNCWARAVDRAGSKVRSTNSAKVTLPPCLRPCCHAAGICRARSRAVTTMWTSVPSSSASAVRTCSGVADDSSSWLITLVPSKARARRHSRAQVPSNSPARCPHCSSMPRISSVAWYISAGYCAGKRTPSSRRVLLFSRMPAWRNDVPLLGTPTWTKTRRRAGLVTMPGRITGAVGPAGGAEAWVPPGRRRRTREISRCVPWSWSRRVDPRSCRCGSGRRRSRGPGRSASTWPRRA